MFPFFPFSVHVVKGHSMQPSIKDGSRLFAFKWAYLFSMPRIGDIIVFRLDGKDYVKRVSSVENGKVSVKGDNASDSLQIGNIKPSSITGKVLFAY